MHITLTRQEAEQLLSEIELNYQQKAVPLIEQAKKLEIEVKEEACKEWDELEKILEADWGGRIGRLSIIMFIPASPYCYIAPSTDFFRSKGYYRLKNSLSSGLGFEIKVDSTDMLSLNEDRSREYKLNDFGNIRLFESLVNDIKTSKEKALNAYKRGTGHDFYEKPEPVPVPVHAPVKPQEPEKPKSFFERLFGG